jgi:hypothetical protein
VYITAGSDDNLESPILHRILRETTNIIVQNSQFDETLDVRRQFGKRFQSCVFNEVSQETVNSVSVIM